MILLIQLILVVLMALTVPVTAQDSLFTRDPVWYSGAGDYTKSIACGDIDLDGDLDLVFGNYAGKNTLYLNEVKEFPQTPDWESETTNNTSSVALGDVDGDGDLDLVCGNFGQGNTLYINDGGTLSLTPVWTSGLANNTSSIALGDVDGDGDLDLVCGNFTQGSTLYINEGGTFSDTTAWTSPINLTNDVALGDVDGDGDLDLVCGNFGQGNTLYVNEGGTFSDTTAWTSPINLTNDVALGDVDGDGDFDLVCGNGYPTDPQSNRLYLNSGAGTFSDTIAWTSPSKATYDVALGDVDGDGDLDLVCGNYGEKSTLYINNGATFSNTPVWTSQAKNNTYSVALLDVDGDGGLDLVCGNYRETNTLYLNQRSAFQVEPAWTSGPTNRTYSVALGDVDGDGDLDLVCGNISQKNTLYLNDGGTFSDTTSWTSAPANITLSVALGDIDGDGDLDLVCGNGGAKGESNTLYLNQGGLFQVEPAWTSGPTNRTYGVALGDVDGDGDLDLVCGNYSQGNTLYLNDGGTFSDTTAWTSGPMNRTYSVALGDVDGDGDLDIVCGNGYPTDPQSNTLYLNDGGTFSDTTAWTSPSKVTYDIALGDVDGDGDLDLVCGNYGDNNTLYLNEAGMFQTMPTWSSRQANDTRGIALGDVDGDSYLDLVCGNWYRSSMLYLNIGGEFTTEPAWSSGEVKGTYMVGIGDVDGDGDLDLVYGNTGARGESNTLYVGKNNPVFKGNPSEPANHLPNNSAFLRFVRTDRAGTNLIRIHFIAVDVESDHVWILPEYQYKGEPRWFPVETPGQKGRVGLFPTSPAGIEDSLDWDISLMPFDRREVVLRLRTISIPKSVSIIHHVSSYFKDIGPIVPMRPQFRASRNSLRFSTVTLGDTVSTDLTISNAGNGDLAINSLQLPSPEMRLDKTAPFTILPGDSVNLTVFLEPRIETSIPGYLEIMSNDPMAPDTIMIPITTDILGLDIDTELLSETEEIPLGEAVTVIITPAPQVVIEGGHLFHRPGGEPAFRDSIPLFRSKSGFTSIIPGESITERGLEYYVKVENSGIFATYPPGAPDTFYTRTVEAPQSVLATAQTNSMLGYLEGREIRIQVTLPEGTVFRGGLLFYRPGGKISFYSDSLLVGDLRPEATIPDSLVGPRGLEYWVEVETETRTLTDPRSDPEAYPRVIQTTVQDLSEPARHPGRRYRMMSIPLDFGTEFNETIEALLSDEIGLYDRMRWRSYRYLPSRGQYVELSDTSRADEFRPLPGRAYWLISRESYRIDTSPALGFSTTTESSFALTLEPGWNMIGSPFDFPVAWDSFLVDTLGGDLLPMAEADSVVEPPIRWVAARGYQYDVGILEPFEGYWVRNLGDSLTLKIPPREAPAGTSGTYPGIFAPGEETEGFSWQIAISASCSEAIDMSNFVGVNKAAKNQWDPCDRSEPPMSPGNSISLYFPHSSWKKHPGAYAIDIRGGYGPVDLGELGLTEADIGGGDGGSDDRELREAFPSQELWGHFWHFDVAKNFLIDDAADEVVLDFSGLESLPAGARAYLVDRYLKRLSDIGKEKTYRFFLGKRDLVRKEEARFLLLVGSEDFIENQKDRLPELPTRTALYQNYPNPFNPSTIIRYDIAEAGIVTLRVYSATGALVKVLYEGRREPGRYEVGWNGDNERGVRVASGIYFCHLEASWGFRETRKIVMIR